jgi:hypothetical protein
MMQFYSITNGTPLPALSLEDIPSLLGRQEALQHAVRIGYEDGKVVTILYGVFVTPDIVQLALTGASGRSEEYTLDSRHHHVQRLTANVEEYAAVLGCTKFIVSTNRGESWLLKRLPEWTQAEDPREGYTTITLEV